MSAASVLAVTYLAYAPGFPQGVAKGKQGFYLTANRKDELGRMQDTPVHGPFQLAAEAAAALSALDSAKRVTP
jgi:hypothetical protein